MANSIPTGDAAFVISDSQLQVQEFKPFSNRLAMIILKVFNNFLGAPADYSTKFVDKINLL